MCKFSLTIESLIYIYKHTHKFIEDEPISFQNSIKYLIEQHPDMYGENQYNAFLDSIWMGSLTHKIYENIEEKNDDDYIDIFDIFSSVSDIEADDDKDEDDDEKQLFNNNNNYNNNEQIQQSRSAFNDDEDDDIDIDVQSLNLTNIVINNGSNNKKNNNSNVRYSSRSFRATKTV